MENLIMNSQWAPGPEGGPQYFSGMGPITYDSLSINGYRTCSITMQNPMTAQDFYNPLIDVSGRSGIAWGFMIRVVDANHISLVAQFFDSQRRSIGISEDPITNRVTYEFNQVLSNFTVPGGAKSVSLSIKFMGKITACTYFAPVAYYL
jgi:hypothetical protein